MQNKKKLLYKYKHRKWFEWLCCFKRLKREDQSIIDVGLYRAYVRQHQLLRRRWWNAGVSYKWTGNQPSISVTGVILVQHSSHQRQLKLQLVVVLFNLHHTTAPFAQLLRLSLDIHYSIECFDAATSGASVGQIICS